MLRINMKGKSDGNFFMNIITLNIMSKAIQNRIGINGSKAEQIACFIMDLFGFDNRIIDNILNPEDRQLLYMLEAEGFLSTGREEEKLHDGREWLTHYWELKKNMILKYAENSFKKREKIISGRLRSENKKNFNIYSNIPDEMWVSRKILRDNYP